MKKSEEKMVRDVVLEEMSKGKIIVLGTKDLIDLFSHTFHLNIDIMMMDFNDQNGAIKTKPVQTYNSLTKEINILGMANKKGVLKIFRSTGIKKDFDENIVKDLILIVLRKCKDESGQDRYHIDTQVANTETDKLYIIDQIFKKPEKDVKDDIKKALYKNKMDEYIGYA